MEEKNEDLTNHLPDARCSTCTLSSHPHTLSSRQVSSPHRFQRREPGLGWGMNNLSTASHLVSRRLRCRPAAGGWGGTIARGKYLSDGSQPTWAARFCKTHGWPVEAADHIRTTLEGARSGAWSQTRPIANAVGNHIALGNCRCVGGGGSWPLTPEFYPPPAPDIEALLWVRGCWQAGCPQLFTRKEKGMVC